MLKTFAAALIAASMLTAPVLAQGTAPAPQSAKVKVVKHGHARHHVKHVHVKHVRHVRHGRHHAKHVSGTRTHAMQHTVGSRPKAN